ncbi:MAG: hypothetical protein QOF89_5843 [Acidobacteriota bacterium]|nr:hypothetical protein [Acidobacteriota bacterium]
MKLSTRIPMLAVAFAACAAPSLFGQAVCSFSVSMVNHNRYAYDTAEECSGWHSVPFGNWGVSSNVGRVVDGHQFQGWNPSCNVTGSTLVEWNSCSRDYVKPDLDCRRLNFPDPAGTAPYPANGYPFTDNYGHNNYVPAAGGNQTCVDQYSPCGPNVYGTVGYNVGVSAVQDLDGDNVMDSGGCKDLDGYQIGVQQNYMSVYELDWDGNDLINSLYFPNVWATLRCTAETCLAANDNNYDGWIDDIYNRSSPEYVQPYLYQDNQNRISYSTDPFVPAKRIDATVRIGMVSGRYSGPYPPGYCGNPSPEESCVNQGGPYWWDSTTCTCRCAGSPSICPPE